MRANDADAIAGFSLDLYFIILCTFYSLTTREEWTRSLRKRLISFSSKSSETTCFDASLD